MSGGCGDEYSTARIPAPIELSAEDEQEAAALFAQCMREGATQGQADAAVGMALGKTPATVRARRETYGKTFAHFSRTGAMGVGNTSIVPDALLADRDRRNALAEQQSITGMLMGDPLPGCSALERARR